MSGQAVARARKATPDAEFHELVTAYADAFAVEAMGHANRMGADLGFPGPAGSEVLAREVLRRLTPDARARVIAELGGA